MPITTIYNFFTKETAKPEEHYVNQYYQFYSKPKIMLETEIWEVKFAVTEMKNTYTYSSRNRNFFPISMTRDLANDKTLLNLREI